MDRLAALGLFERLARLGSFSAAAAACRVKQSTASKWVTALEEELGVQLAVRTTRSVRLTEAGQALAARIPGLLAAWDDLEGEVRARATELRGRLRVSLPVVYGRRYVVPVVARFLAAHPHLALELTLSDRYVSLVDEGFDLAVRVGMPVDASTVGRKIADGRRVLVAAPTYVAARGRPRRPADLVSHECLVHGEPGTPAVWRFAPSKGGPTRPVTVRGRASANNSEAVLALCREGVGVALLADWLVADAIAKRDLVALLPRFHAPPAPVYALVPASRHVPAAVRALVDHLAEEL